MYKNELIKLYNDAGDPMSKTTLQRLMNERYFAQLSAVGYRKRDKILSPKVIECFYSLYGEPLKP